MKRLTLALTITIALAGTAYAKPPWLDSIGTQTYGFAGYTSTEVNPAGLSNLHKACQNDFGPEARMCTSMELMLSPNLEGPGNGIRAWVLPLITGGHGRFDSTIDISGVSTTVGLTCRGWNPTGNSIGLVISDDGRFGGQNCNTASPVACCVPQ